MRHLVLADTGPGVRPSWEKATQATAVSEARCADRWMLQHYTPSVFQEPYRSPHPPNFQRAQWPVLSSLRGAAGFKPPPPPPGPTFIFFLQTAVLSRT